MSSFSFTVPATAPATARSAAITKREALYGHDVYYNVRETLPNMTITASGDWARVSGRECLRQSLIRRLITEPGSWTTLASYGVGAVAYVKARDSRANRDELERKIRSQFMRDPRVASVDAVTLTRGTNSLRISVKVTPVGEVRGATPLVVTHEVN